MKVNAIISFLDFLTGNKITTHGEDINCERDLLFIDFGEPEEYPVIELVHTLFGCGFLVPPPSNLSRIARHLHPLQLFLHCPDEKPHGVAIPRATALNFWYAASHMFEPESKYYFKLYPFSAENASIMRHLQSSEPFMLPGENFFRYHAAHLFGCFILLPDDNSNEDFPIKFRPFYLEFDSQSNQMRVYDYERIVARAIFDRWRNWTREQKKKRILSALPTINFMWGLNLKKSFFY